jgi:hypothetical protein
LARLINEDIFNYLNFNPDVEGGATFAVPNELITDFKDTHKIGKCAYAYSYYYLTMYLHLYAKYGSEQSIDKFTFGNIQKLLGISADSRAMNSLTKKGGELDSLGYTSTQTDYPVSLMRLERVDEMMEVHHYWYSEERRDFPDRFNHSNSFTAKHPDKMYWRDEEAKADEYYNGTMNEADSTHIIPLEMFLHAMNLEKIMTKGFYVYGYIIYMNDKTKRKEGWTVALEIFSQFLGVGEKTLRKILKSLEHHGFIKVKRQKKMNGVDLPNTYIPITNPKKVVY